MCVCVCMFACVFACAEIVGKGVVFEVLPEAYVAEFGVCLLVCVRQSKGGGVQIHRAPLY